MEAPPHIRTLEMRDQDGKPFSAKDLSGKFAVVMFGTLDSTPLDAITNMAKWVAGAGCAVWIRAKG
jgi:hypothetical protein